MSHRADAMAPFIVMDVLEKAQQLERERAPGGTVLHLEVGEPDFPTPPPVVAHAVDALSHGATHYTGSMGIAELREQIAGRYREHYGVVVDPAQVMVTAGSSPAMAMLALALLDCGDELVVPDPGYACYANYALAAGGQVVRAPAGATQGYRLTAEAVGHVLTPRTRAVLVNSPANPTGAMLSAPELRDLVELAERHGIWLISDEIYHGLSYTASPEPTAWGMGSRVIVVDGFSKRYAMTGWRLGWCVLPAPLVRTLQKLQQNLMICAPSFAQHAGVAALQHGEPFVAEMRAAYDRRRRLVLEGLQAMGVPVAGRPEGAFYVLADLRPWGCTDSHRFAFDLLEQTGVAVAPGIDFGPGGEGHVRISYASSPQTLTEGLGRLGEYLARRGPGRRGPGPAELPAP